MAYQITFKLILKGVINLCRKCMLYAAVFLKLKTRKGLCAFFYLKIPVVKPHSTQSE